MAAYAAFVVGALQGQDGGVSFGNDGDVAAVAGDGCVGVGSVHYQGFVTAFTLLMDGALGLGYDLAVLHPGHLAVTLGALDQVAGVVAVFAADFVTLL